MPPEVVEFEGVYYDATGLRELLATLADNWRKAEQEAAGLRAQAATYDEQVAAYQAWVRDAWAALAANGVSGDGQGSLALAICHLGERLTVAERALEACRADARLALQRRNEGNLGEAVRFIKRVAGENSDAQA